MGLLLLLEGFYGDRSVSPRRRVEPRVKALAVRLYHQGLSPRMVRSLLSKQGDGWVFSHRGSEAMVPQGWVAHAGEKEA